MSIFYLVQSSPTMSRFAASRAGQVLAVLGRHSLEVFSAGTLLDLFAKLLFATFGSHWALQIGINVIGLGTLFLLARALDRRKTQRKLEQKQTEQRTERQQAEAAQRGASHPVAAS